MLYVYFSLLLHLLGGPEEGAELCHINLIDAMPYVFARQRWAAAALMMTLAWGLMAQTTAFEPNRYELKLADFSQLVVINNIPVEYVSSADSAGMVVFYATRQNASCLLFDNNKGRLKVQSACTDDPSIPLPTVRVYSSLLEKVENGGDTTLTLINVAPVPKFQAKVIGNGRITAPGVKATRVEAVIAAGKGSIDISGQCLTAKMSIAGKGVIQAEALQVVDLTCTMMGPGRIYCAPTGQLTLKGMSSGGVVYYLGTPTAIRNRSLGVKAQPKSEE